jgi:zinc/manganese transport system permease protein
MFEMFGLSFMVQALIVSLITGLFLSYLGLHVVIRGIVFVDLAIGQIASLGSAFGAFLGYGLTTIPIIFTLVGALLISLINIRDKRLKLEAVIGIFYAFASALTVMVISKTPHGDSDIQEVLFGNILSVSVKEIRTIAIIYAILAFIHLIFYRKFFELDENISTSKKTGHIQFDIWNMIFYISIGIAIVFSVKTAGVIPVFSYLIFPSVCAIILSRAVASMIIISIMVTIIGNFFGLYVSYHFDFPAGSSIVAVLGCIFVIISVYRILRNITQKHDPMSV